MTTDYVLRESGIQVPAGATVQLRERIAELEFALEDRDWLTLAGAASHEFSRGGLQTISRICRLMYLKNPLIKRGVSVKADYVFGRGVNISAKDELINEIVQAFINDDHNRAEFIGQQSRLQKDVELETDGNIFFVFFIHPMTGSVRMRTISCDEIVDIITDPNDAKKPWFYKRVWNENTFDFVEGIYRSKARSAYYIDWRYHSTTIPTRIGTVDVMQAPVYHVKIGGFSDWKFGVPGLYSAIDWAKAYKVFLENWSTIVAAYARFAFKATTTGGAKGLDAAKRRLSTDPAHSTGIPPNTNAKPTTGATVVAARDRDGQSMFDLEPIRTAGATTSAEDGRRLLLMVAAATGLPETFFGDVSVGTLATASSLDRPTELQFANRQMFWHDVYRNILTYVLFWAAKAPDGKLRGVAEIISNEYAEDVIRFDEDTNDHIDIDFPPIVEHDLQAYINALVSGATLNGQVPTVISDMRLLARMILTQLGENDIDEILDQLYPPTENNAPEIDPANPIDASLLQATETLRESIEKLAGAMNGASTSND
jgi:hypothetical protein